MLGVLRVPVSMSKAISAKGSRLMIMALIVSGLAIASFGAAYFGEWWMIHREHPGEFPNDPESDHGFRLLKMYWMTDGAARIIHGAELWALGLLLYLVAGFRRQSSLKSRSGVACGVIHGVLCCYALWLVVSFGLQRS